MAVLDLEPVDRVDITTTVDNTTDMLLADSDSIRRWGLSGSAGELPQTRSDVAVSGFALDFLRAEHGYSALVEVHHGDGVRRVLYDTGVTPDGLIDNLDRLQIDPSTFETIVLSHGHFDHVMGLHGLIGRLGRRNLPLVLHPEAWTERRLASPNRVIELPTLSRRAVEAAGLAVVEQAQPSFLLGGAVLITGQVARTTDFEKGMPPGHQARRGEEWQHDPYVHDDQALVLNVRDRGLVIMTGCGHAGIVNIVDYAKELTGIDQVYAILGGLHLRDGPVVAASVAALVEQRPQLIAPAHCTSWAAHHALVDAFPTAYRPNGVGTRFELSSPAPTGFDSAGLVRNSADT